VPKHAIKLIVNPTADMGRAWRFASDLRPLIDEHGGADWSGTAYPTHAVELARHAAEEGYELVIAAGGDGTVHEVINGLMQVPREMRPCLGIVPLGSGNDFSSAVGMDPRAVVALQQVLSGVPRAMDVGRLVDNQGRCEYWNNTLGIGFDAKAVIHSRQVPLVRGFLVYLLAAMKTILLNHEAPQMKVLTDRETWQKDLLLFVLCNGGREGNGFHICPPASPFDGIFNYTAVERVSRLKMVQMLPAFMQGRHVRFRQVSQGQFTRLELAADRPLTIHTDGEIYAGFGVDVRRLTVEILPGEIQVITPAAPPPGR
jgi:diacylglycerol kinase (ATP)